MTRPALAAAFALACAVAVTAGGRPARAGWWDEAGVPRRIALDALFVEPEAWVDVPVIVRVTYAGRAEAPDPYFTRFTERRWRPLRCWPAAVAEIDRSESNAFARLFVRRGAATDRRGARLAPGDRVDVHAVVRDVVRGVPWFEVLEITGDGDPLTVLERAERDLGDRFGRSGNEAAAERIYRRLLASRELPPADRADLLRRIGTACTAQGNWTPAVKALEAAQALAPDDSGIEEALARARARSGTATAGPTPDAKRPTVPGTRPTSPADTGRPARPGVRPPAGLDDAPAKGAVEETPGRAPSEAQDEEKDEGARDKEPETAPPPAPLPKPRLNEPK